MKYFSHLPFSWLCTTGAALFLLIYSASFSQAAAASGTQVFGDSLLPSAARPAGAAVQGTSLTEGGGKWNATPDVTISSEGATYFQTRRRTPSH